MKQPPPAYLPPKADKADTAALQALARGEASTEQQKRALRWIIEAAAATYDQSYRPDTHETAFAEGRRFVGNTLVKELKINLLNLKERKSND